MVEEESAHLPAASRLHPPLPATALAPLDLAVPEHRVAPVHHPAVQQGLLPDQPVREVAHPLGPWEAVAEGLARPAQQGDHVRRGVELVDQDREDGLVEQEVGHACGRAATRKNVTDDCFHSFKFSGQSKTATGDFRDGSEFKDKVVASCYFCYYLKFPGVGQRETFGVVLVMLFL